MHRRFFADAAAVTRHVNVTLNNLNSAVAGRSKCEIGDGLAVVLRIPNHEGWGKTSRLKTGGGIRGEENNQRSRLRADRAFGVCANEHDDYRAKDNYSTNNDD